MEQEEEGRLAGQTAVDSRALSTAEGAGQVDQHTVNVVDGEVRGVVGEAHEEMVHQHEMSSHHPAAWSRLHHS